MYKTKLAIFFDTIFIAAITFIIAYVILFRQIKNAILCFLICNIIALISFFIFFKISIKKHKLSNLNNKDLKLADKCFNSLKFLDNESYNKFFAELLNARQISERIFFNGYLYFYINTKQDLDSTDFFVANNYFKSKNLTHPLCFLCSSANQNFIDLINTSPITYELYTSNDIFLLMKDSNKYPFTDEPEHKNFILPHKLKTKFLSSITRNHFKDFFISGLSLITLSLFIPFSKYYMIFGIILLSLAIASLFIKNKVTVAKAKTPLTELTKKNDT